MLLPHELIVDNFAGGGGTSTGLELGFGRPVDIAINHDPKALAMHRLNHSKTTHYCESVWDVDPVEITANQPVGLVWLSPDCRHFSKLKGKKPVEKNIRGLAWIALRWASKTRPRVIMLENVKEFQTWGDLGKDGRPCPKNIGRTFNCFVNALKYQGYKVEWRELRACDYGSPTIRSRFFLIARRDGLPIEWPKITHGDPKSMEVRTGRLLPWRTALECMDFSHDSQSIFQRKRPLSVGTLDRIAGGIAKYVLGRSNPVVVGNLTPILTECANASSSRAMPIDEPLRTICAQTKGGHHAVILPRIAPFDANSAHLSRDTHILLESYLARKNDSNGAYTHLIRQYLDDGYFVIDSQKSCFVDVNFRMVQPDELYRAQGFGDQYQFKEGLDEYGNRIKLTKTESYRMVGNSVCPEVSKALVQANFSHEKIYSNAA